MRRVVVTGMGAITPIGLNVDSFWTAIRRKEIGFAPITHFDASEYKCHIAAEVKGFAGKDYMDFKSAKRMELFSQYAVAASKEALADSNEVWMLEHAVYSILSPEGFASILWKDGRRAKEAASVMKITAQDLRKLQVIDGIIPEFGGADEEACESIVRAMKRQLKRFLTENRKRSGEELAAARYERFRKF